MKSCSHGPLPFMKTMKDAVALCQKERDNFYVTAFMIEAWLGEATMRAVAEYAEKKEAKNRRMQDGETRRVFQECFGHVTDAEFHHVFTSLLRFAEYDDVQAEMLRRAMVPVAFEHDCDGDFVGPKTIDVARQREKAVKLMRRTVDRWGEWLDAVVHFQTHEGWHLSPERFDPDPDKRELAALGVNQRFFFKLSDFSRKWWEWHHGEAAGRFKGSPKWRTVGKAMAASQTKTWNHPAMDQAVIMFWPLLKRHNWSYLDLLNVLRRVAPRPDACPFPGEKEFSTYCVNVLGLHKNGRGKTAGDGRPPGYEVALRLCGQDAVGRLS